ncbi:hypothetical protein D3C84_894180 [compost metagenome]
MFRQPSDMLILQLHLPVAEYSMNKAVVVRAHCRQQQCVNRIKQTIVKLGMYCAVQGRMQSVKAGHRYRCIQLS